MSMVKDLANRFNVIAGLSDHTIGSTVPIVATIFGAKIIEKHFIIDRSIGGPDASFSMNENEFADMVRNIRDAELAVGQVQYSLTEKQKKGKNFSRSLYVVQDIKEGEVITDKNIKSIRPGFGLHPKYFSSILGKKINKELFKGERFNLEYISNEN
jgi:pseudaminic acid synthase